MNTNVVTAKIPLPIQIVIDDVGWWSGENGSTRHEPYRSGISRNHVPADYHALVSLGRQLNMKPQAALILCEWDKNNILKDLPSCTWMGAAWDNTRWVGPWHEEAAAIMRDGRRHMELTLHGIGHEYWAASPSGAWEFTRAEWHDRDGTMRPRAEVRARLQYFQALMDQHNLGDFPTSFVPCAFLHRFAAGAEGLAPLLAEAGVNFISTPFHRMHGNERVKHKWFDFDAGVMTVDRGQDLLRWFDISTPPSGDLSGPICGMHWPNILHETPERNEEIVAAWVQYLKEYDQRVDWMLAPDTAAFATQLAHHVCTAFKGERDGIAFDFADFNQLPRTQFQDHFTVKVNSPTPLRFSYTGLKLIGVKEDGSTLSDTLYTLTLCNAGQPDTARLDWH